jgi:SAM-dependent methyltransferase
MSSYNLETMEQAERYNRFLLGLVLPQARGKRALDFGAGSGTFARRLAAEGVDVTCVEPDTQLRAQLHRDGLRNYGQIEALAAESFDLVYSFNVLEHIEDDLAALAELRRVLKPGGRLVLYVPAFMVLYSAMDRRVGHRRRYRKAALAQLTVRAGFTVDEVRYADSLGFLAALAFRALGPGSGELNPRAVRLYDRWVFPLSRALDLGLGALAGRNVILRAHR